jgi:hypothetical protein
MMGGLSTGLIPSTILQDPILFDRCFVEVLAQHAQFKDSKKQQINYYGVMAFCMPQLVMGALNIEHNEERDLQVRG